MKKHLLIFTSGILLLFLVPQIVTDFLRDKATLFGSVIWKPVTPKKSLGDYSCEELHLENILLREQIDRLKHWILSQKQVEESINGAIQDPLWMRKKEYLTRILSLQNDVLPARVIFREPIYWNSCLWVNVGEKDNQALGKIIVEKDSPVVIGKTLVGIVEEVMQSRSKVRLLTDPRVSVAVRGVVGGERNEPIWRSVSQLKRLLSFREDMEGASDFIRILEIFQRELPLEPKDRYLSKGILSGVTPSFARSGESQLKGIGFNDYFMQEERIEISETNPLAIEKGSLLVTTGLDGLFPPGLHVAVVSKVYPIKEGECSYHLEAHPLFLDQSPLQEVYILPNQLK